MEEMEYYQQGVTLMQQKDLDGAIAMFNRGMEEYPDSFTILSIRASTYERKGERDKAMADYTRMIALRPDNPDGWNARGNVYRLNGEYDKAIADYTACISLSPQGDGRGWSNRGMAYYESGNMRAALADLNKAVACWEELPGADPSCIAKSLTHRGIVLWMLGEFDKAEEDIERGKDNGLDEDFVFHQIGYLYSQRHEFDKAVEFYSQCIAIDGGNAEAWRSRGACYWNQRIKEKLGFWTGGKDLITRAIADYTKALELDPRMTEAYFNRGMIHSTTAQESFHMLKGILKMRTKNDAGRLLLLAQLENMGGEDLIPSFNALLQGLRFNQDKKEEFISACLGAIAKKDAEDAAGDLTRALELAPDNPEVWYQRGVIYALLGQREQALADYDRACELNPAHAKALEKRDALRAALRERMEQEDEEN